MTHTDPIRERVLAIAEPVCAAAGYELVDVRFKAEQGGWVLRIFIDVPPADGAAADLAAVPADLVDLSDCEQLSRELSAVLDVEDPIPHQYSLEVSSPGIDRPLRTVEHFRRFIGAEVKIAMAVPIGDRRNFKGQLVSVEADAAPVTATVEVDGQRHALRLTDIESARLVPDWDAVMRGGSGIGPTPAPVHKPHPKGAHPKQALAGQPKQPKERPGRSKR